MSIAFVTGITGQDGSYLVDGLVRDGVEVHGLVRAADAAAAELRARHPGVVLHEGDLAEPSSLKRLILDVGPDQVFNLGGISSVAYSWERPDETAVITGLSVATLLQASLEVQQRDGRPVSFVQASSSEIFGNPPMAPQDESTPIRPTSPYGAAKAYAHHLVGVYRAQELHAVSCILYNHESTRRPEAFVTRKITAGVARIAAGLQDKLSMGSLEVRRDWGWAPDYVRALRLAQQHHTADDYVIATGQTHSVEEFVGAAFAAAGIDDWQNLVEIDPRFIRPAEISSMQGDASKARRVLGWQPSVAFDELVTLMVRHDLELLNH